MASYIGQQPARQSIVLDDAITSAKIFDGTVAGADLASDITISTTGTITTSQVNLGDNEKISLGTSGSDFDMFHQGSYTALRNFTGNLYLGAPTSGGAVAITNQTISTTSARFDIDGPVELFYNNAKKFETTNTGATITGTLVADGLTVDTDTLYVDSVDDRVGIGTTDPQANLDIVGSFANGRALQIRGGDTNTGTDSSQIIFTYDGRNFASNGFGHSIKTRHDAGSKINNAIDFWVWDYGTDTASTLGTLRQMIVNGEGVSITDDLTVDTDTLYVDSTNNRVGIGTASPTYDLQIEKDGGGSSVRLDVVNTGVATGDDTLLSFVSGSNNNENIIYFGDADDTNIGQIRYDHAFDSMEFYTNASENMRITSSGNVGIGTNNPTSKLDVQDNTGSLSATNDITAEFHRSDGTYGPRLQIRHSTSGSDIRHTYGSGANNLTFSIANDEHMRITSSGNVGIGTSSPLSKLDVFGPSSVTSFTGTSHLGLTVRGSSAATDYSGIDFIGNNQVNPIARVGVLTTGSGSSLSFGTSNSYASGVTNTAMTINPSGNVGIGTTSPAYELDVVSSESSTDLRVRNNGTGSARLRLSSGGSSSSSAIDFGDDADSNVGNITYFHNSNYMSFVTGADEHMRIDSTGDVIIGDNLGSVQPGLNNSTQAICLRGGSTEQFFISSASAPMFINRTVDGSLVSFRSNGTAEGTISVSGTTVTYGGFTGTHWSRLIDNSKPTILKGTILESLDEMMDWYQVQFDITETDDEGNETTRTQRESYALGDGESVGDVITYNYEGTDYQATIIKEGDVKHTKSKISDTVDAKNVYGVFVAWDDDDDSVNDMYVAQTGSYIIRINGSETVSKGDLIQSNGDGTGKVQSDDIIRASTVAKVISSTKVETYGDGSYTVPCTLHC